MYSIKIVYEVEGNGVSNKKGNPDEKVVPTATELFEAERVRHYKVSINSSEEFEKLNEDLLEKFGSFSYIGRENGYPTEFVVLTLCREGECSYFLICGASIFITNQKGSTVDMIKTA